jgi:hypothetical protein
MRLINVFRPIFFTLILFGFFVSLIFILKILFSPSYIDFRNYYFNLHAFIHGGDPNNSSSLGFFYYPLYYPPPAILLLLPFTVLPLIISEKIYIIFSFLCLFLSIKIIFRTFQIPIFSWLSIFLITLFFNFFPLKFTLVMGQVNILILLLLAYFIYCYKNNKQYLSGIALATAISLKFIPLLIIPYLALTKRWKILTSMLLTLIIVFGASYIILPDNTTAFFFTHTLPNILQVGEKTSYYDQSLFAFFPRALHNQISIQSIRTISAVILIATYTILWLYRRSKSNNLLSISSLIILNIILNGSAEQHHFIWLIIPLFVTFFYIHNRQLNNNWLYAILGSSYLLMALNLKNPTSFPAFIWSHEFYGAVFLYGLIIYLIIFKSDKSMKNNNKKINAPKKQVEDKILGITIE